jgi:hypothetical protein
MAPVDAPQEHAVEVEAPVWQLRKGCVAANTTEGINQNYKLEN